MKKKTGKKPARRAVSATARSHREAHVPSKMSENVGAGDQSPLPRASLGRIVTFEDPAFGARPAMIVKVWEDEITNLLVFYDGSNDAKVAPVEWVTSVIYDASGKQPRTWRWPARV